MFGNIQTALAQFSICTCNLMVRITYDPARNQRNMAERQLPFDEAAGFDFETALIHVDERRNCSETRYVALGFSSALARSVFCRRG